MPLPLIADSLDAIPEGARGAYVERESKFYLDAAIEDTSGLKATNAKLIAEKRALAARVAVLGERTAEEVTAELDYAASQREKAAKDAGDFDSLKTQLVTATNAEKAVLNARIAKIETKLFNVLGSSVAERAIAAKGIKAKVLLPHVLPYIKIVEHDGEYAAQVVDDAGKPRIADGQATPMTIEQLVDEFVANPDFAGIVPASGMSGGGARNDGSQRGSVGVVIIPRDASPQTYQHMKADAEKRGVPYKIAD
jgi:hypothetical protein